MIGRIDAVPTHPRRRLPHHRHGLRGGRARHRGSLDRLRGARRDRVRPGARRRAEVATTICNEIRDSGEAVVIDHVAEDPAYRGHPTPALYGFQSYISMPICRRDGAFFGTLCAIDPRPRAARHARDDRHVQAVRRPDRLPPRRRRAAGARARRRCSTSAQTAELREQFIAVLGHDLRNPLAAIDAPARGCCAKAPLDETPAMHRRP